MPKTYQQQFQQALACETKEEAERWLAKEIIEYRSLGVDDPKKAKETILTNLGYMAGYYDTPTAKKIEELFGAGHPIFGGSDYHDNMTPKQAFDAGVKVAELYRRNKE